MIFGNSRFKIPEAIMGTTCSINMPRGPCLFGVIYVSKKSQTPFWDRIAARWDLMYVLSANFLIYTTVLKSTLQLQAIPMLCLGFVQFRTERAYSRLFLLDKVQDTSSLCLIWNSQHQSLNVSHSVHYCLSFPLIYWNTKFSLSLKALSLKVAFHRIQLIFWHIIWG